MPYLLSRTFPRQPSTLLVAPHQTAAVARLFSSALTPRATRQTAGLLYTAELQQRRRHNRSIPSLPFKPTTYSNSAHGANLNNTGTMATLPPSSLTETVVAAMKSLFPEQLADSAWDNTGLLLGEAVPASAPKLDASGAATVLLTNDLTPAVVDEALQEGAKMIICYHPVIFRPLKSLVPKDPMSTSLLRLAAERVSVYCPHTAMDAAHGGLNDWLCDIVLSGDAQVEGGRTVPEPITRPVPQGHEGSGYGREVQMAEPRPLSTLIRRFAEGLGGMRYVQVALPPSMYSSEGVYPDVSRFAVCAGSGSGVLKDCADAQVLFTGEMSHHDALRHAQAGQAVVTCFHSNSERQYLTQRLKPMLDVQLETTSHARTRVLVSKADRDPFQIVDIDTLKA